MIFYLFNLFLFITLITACGKKSGDSGSPAPWSQQEAFEQGEYRVVLQPLNGAILNHKTLGTAKLKLLAEEFIVNVNLTNSHNSKHLQNIHASGKCPDTTHDTNKDGYIDIYEGSNAFGKILIPLDSDLATQAAGADYAPTGAAYSYSESAKIAETLTDLFNPETHDQDFITKLKPTGSLMLAGRTLVVLGASQKNSLPVSIATLPDQTPEATIPIACGQIKRILPE